MKKEYPKFIYHAEGHAKIVHSEKEHKEHPEWKESPAHFEVAQEEVKDEPKEQKLKKKKA